MVMNSPTSFLTLSDQPLLTSLLITLLNTLLPPASLPAPPFPGTILTAWHWNLVAHKPSGIKTHCCPGVRPLTYLGVSIPRTLHTPLGAFDLSHGERKEERASYFT